MSHRVMEVTLRPATLADRERVFAYNVAPATRAVSGSPRTFSLSEHERWFTERLADAVSRMWIVEDSGVPVGVVRIDAGDPARISIALEPSAQGRNIGRRAVALACALWAAPIRAEIHEGNAASHACFVASGFVRIGKRDVFDLFQWSP